MLLRRTDRFSDQVLRRIAFAIAAIALAALAATPFAGRGLEGLPGVSGGYVPVGDLVVDGCVVLIAVVLTMARPRNLVGWVLLAFATLGTVQNFTEAYGVRAQALPHDGLPFGPLALSLGVSLWVPALVLPATLLLNLYPDGRAASRRWQWVNRAAVLGMVVATVAIGTAPGAVHDDLKSADPVVAAPHGVTVALGALTVAILLGCVAASVVGGVRRTVRARAPERQQLLLLLVSISVLLVLTVLGAPKWLFDVGLVAIPVAVAVGVLRYRLLGVEVVIRRTIQFGVLTALVVGVYAAGAAALSSVLPDVATRVGAGALVALVLIPLRDRLQTGVDRLVYGARRDPLRALHQVGRTVTSASTEPLVAVAAAVAGALRARRVAVVDVDGTTLAATGAVPSGPASVQPLRFGGERIADLVVHPAAGETALPLGDQRLLDALAVPVAAVVRAERLNLNLAAAQEREASATRAERARIRRDLHDGLGPSLAGVQLGLEALEADLPAASSAADLVTRMRVEMTRSVDEVRRIIDALHPGALEAVGLVPALQERAAAIAARSRSPLAIEVNAPEPMPALPAPVQAATLRIAEEAMTNVVRHASASRCQVTLTVDDALSLRVCDDGLGLPGDLRRGGVGLASIRQRAAELGGSCEIGTGQPRGVTVAVRLPLQVSGD